MFPDLAERCLRRRAVPWLLVLLRRPRPSDQATKATITLVLQLNRIDFANDRLAAPFLTLPIGR
jgi:hypothetical protein